MRQPGYQAAFFVALLSTALALGAALAHALELPNKLGSSGEAYFTMQQIYRGWSLLGLLLFVELASIVSVWIFHLPGQRGDAQLDDAARELAGIARAMGIFARGRRSCAGRGNDQPDRRRARAAGPRPAAAVTRSSWKSRGSVTSPFIASAPDRA